jgi:hypothetical protein
MTKDRIEKIDHLLKFLGGKFGAQWEIDMVEQLLIDEKKRYMKEHRCFESFPTQKIDECKGDGTNMCIGIDPMVLSLWTMGKDGQECYYDDFVSAFVNYCPFCGLKAQSVEEKPC